MTDAAAPPASATPAERRAFGAARRKHCPREHLAKVPRARDAGRDPQVWLEASNAGRVPELVAERHGRMLVSPLAFYRGAASLMARDLATLPHSGVMAQLCGDAHLVNFGFFASPERALVFDVNDFDETAPGPFDWDLRRLATSFVIAARDRGFKPRVGRDAVTALAEAYREHMRRFAAMDTLDAWYWRLTADTLLQLGSRDAAELAVIRKARRSTSRVFAEASTEMVDGRLMLSKSASFAYRDAEATRREIGAFRAGLPTIMAQYRASLPPERQVLLDRYRLHDVAVLTPGVGSVGLRCFVLLLVADQRHPLFLQCKQAVASVLQPAADGACRRARGAARGQRSAAHAGGQRHLPWVGHRGRRSGLLHAAVARHEGLLQTG